MMHLTLPRDYDIGLFEPGSSDAPMIVRRLQTVRRVSLQTEVLEIKVATGPPDPTPISVLPQISSEEDLLSNITKWLKILYDKVQKAQENANVVGNLRRKKLWVPHRSLATAIVKRG